jgi:flavin reductase (DIM6/NTAB) family NADH-FMN oxidoreductase RutF
MNFDTSTLPVQDNYRLLNGGVTPRPIAWISTQSKSGVDNLAPYSFFTVVSCNPPVLMYTQVTQRSSLDKDTLQNLKETGECVVNIANSLLLSQVNTSSASLNSEVSEFDFANVKKVSSYLVRPFSVAESPVRYECTLRELITVSDLPASGTMVLLDVKSVYVKDQLYIDNNIDQTSLDTIGKMGGSDYCHTTQLTSLNRPE